jgi:hypothetical protein
VLLAVSVNHAFGFVRITSEQTAVHFAQSTSNTTKLGGSDPRFSTIRLGDKYSVSAWVQIETYDNTSNADVFSFLWGSEE